MATGSTAQAAVEFSARVDAAEVYASYIERMAAAYGDAAVGDWDLDTVHALRGHAFDDPEPPAPAAPNVIPFPRPFDRAAHCRRIGAHGGAATVARHGTAHMAAIGKAGARTTIDRHGVAFFRGIVTAKGWAGPRTPELVADLAGGGWLAVGLNPGMGCCTPTSGRATCSPATSGKRSGPTWTGGSWTR